MSTLTYLPKLLSRTRKTVLQGPFLQEEAMPSQKKRARRRTARRAAARRARRSVSSSPRAASQRLNELNEALDIMLPELTARIAAVEHLLVEKQLCTHDDLIRSREFVDLRQDKS